MLYSVNLVLNSEAEFGTLASYFSLTSASSIKNVYEAVTELDSVKGLYPESVKELHWATELALCAIKQMAHSSLIV